MNQSLTNMSGDLAALVEKHEKSVVSIAARRGYPSSGVVWSADGLIVTAQHTVEWDHDMAVGFGDGSVAKGELVGRDPATDIALVRVDRSGLTAPRWTGLEGVRVGNLVLSVARTGRLRAALGILGACGEGWRTRAGGRIDSYVEIDLKPHPGFSGSALADASGNLLGMNTAGLKRATTLAVPFSTLERVASTLIGHGRVRRGFLGIATHPVALPAAVRRKPPSESRGLLVVSVQPDSPADRAGLLLGDVILSYGGSTLETPLDLLANLDEDSVGVPVTVRILRAGATHDVEVIPTHREGNP